MFLNDFPDNSLMHLGRNDCNFRVYCEFGKSEIAKINLFHFEPKTAKMLNEAERRNDILSRIFACHILGELSYYIFHICDMQHDKIIYNYMV